MLVALELESQLAAAGCAIVGPAGTLEQAERLLEKETFAVAVLDANLGGQPVDRLAAALKRKGVPFAFATGYGREALPPGYQDVPLLAKPFRSEDLLEVVATLAARYVGAGRVATPQD